MIEVVALSGAAGSVRLRNTTADPVDLNGWFLCQFPSYWPMPPLMLPAGEAVTVHVGEGEETDTELFAAGGFGTLGASGEVGVYSSGAFDSPAAMVAYVAWGTGGPRGSVAAAAGLWGGRNLEAAEGDALLRTGDGPRADAYSVEAGGAALAIPDLY